MSHHEIVDFHASTPGEADTMASQAAADLAVRRGEKFASVASVKRLDDRTAYRAKISFSSGKPPKVAPKPGQLLEGESDRPRLPGMAERSRPRLPSPTSKSQGTPNEAPPSEDLTPVETPAAKARREHKKEGK